jgi:hypothetical protein
VLGIARGVIETRQQEGGYLHSALAYFNVALQLVVSGARGQAGFGKGPCLESSMPHAMRDAVNTSPSRPTECGLP